MNELFAMMQKIGAASAGMPTIRFRDVLQLLLLSAAVKIVDRANRIICRMGMPPNLGMQAPTQIGYYGVPIQSQLVQPGIPVQPPMMQGAPVHPQVIVYPQQAEQEVR